MSTSTHPVVILGAGLSGLSLAWVLKSLKIPFVVLEKQGKLGGVIQGESLDGYTLDLGPQTFMLEPELKVLIVELGLEPKLTFPSSSSKSKFIGSIKNNYLKEITKNLLSVFKNFIIKPKDLPYIFKDLFIKRASHSDLQDISLHDLSMEIFGPHITEEVLAPAMIGVWATSLENLSTKSLFPAMFEAYKSNTSLVKALFEAKKKKVQTQGKADLGALKGGLSTLINSLIKDIGDENILTGVNIKEISFSESSKLTYIHKGETKEIHFSKLISAVPSYELNSVLEQTNISREGLKQYRELLQKIEYSPIGIVHSKIKNSDYPNKKSGFGVLIPPGHSQALLGTIFTSEIFKERAPDGYTLFTSFVGGSVYPDKVDVRDSKNSEIALEELKQILKLSTTPELVKATFWEKAIPQYKVGHDELVASLLEIERCYPLLLHGNYLDGTSIPHQVRRSFVLGARVALDISNSKGPSIGSGWPVVEA